MEFFSTVFKVALPIILQQLAQSCVNMLDTIMVGQLGAVEIAAVGLANQFYFILNMLLFGITSGGSIFVAQYWGKKDIKGIRSTLGMTVTIAFIAGVIFSLAGVLSPRFCIGIYSRDSAVIETGAEYLRIAALSYPVTAISFAWALTLRSSGNMRLPTIATVSSLLVNAVLNYFLIFTCGLGVRGAAWATLVSRFIEFVILIIFSYRNKMPAAGSPPELFSFTRDKVAKFLRIAFPVIVNESLWGLGISMQNVIFARSSTDAIAAFNITGTISQITWVFFIGVGNAAGIIIGKKIGERDETGARKYAAKFAWFMPLSAVFFGLLLFPLSKMLPLFFNVAPSIIEQASLMLIVLMCTYPFKGFNMCMVVGICRSGGDTIFAAFMDVAFMWFVSLPLGAVASLVWHWLPWQVYICIVSEDVIKVVAGIIRLKSGRWLHNVTE